MRAYLADWLPLRVLALRALVGYPLLRALLVVAAAFVAAFAGRDAGASLESPAGVVLIAMALGAVDVRRRGESVLWADLGYSPLVAPGLFGAAAVAGEFVLALLLAWLRP